MKFSFIKIMSFSALAVSFMSGSMMSSAHAQISYHPINPSQSNYQRPLFGGPPLHSKLPFDIKAEGEVSNYYSLTLNQQGNFNVSLDADMANALVPPKKDDSDDSDDNATPSAPDPVTLHSHSILNKTKWPAALNGDDDALSFFSHQSIASSVTHKYGPSLTGVTIAPITSGPHVGSLLVQGPQDCRYILRAEKPQIADGSISYDFRIPDISEGCKTVAYPTHIHTAVSQSNSLIIQRDESGESN